MDRQKMLTIFAAAWVSAALLTWFLYASTKAPKQEKQIQVLAAARDLPVGSRIGKDDVKMVTMLDKEKPRTAMLTPAEAIGRAVVYPVNANEPVTSSRLTAATSAEGAAAIIEPGKRAASIPFTDASGAAGLIQPKSRVDVLFTRTGNAFEAMTVTVLEDIEVLSIGRVTQVDSAPAGTATKAGSPAVGNQNQNRTATVVVTPEQAQRLELAKNQGRISLVLRNPMDRGVRQDPKASTLEEIEPLLLARSGQTPRRARLTGNLKDPKAWANLIGDEPSAAPKPPPKPPEKKEPPKPRAVVDVFRGEKHVQEIFQ